MKTVIITGPPKEVQEKINKHEETHQVTIYGITSNEFCVTVIIQTYPLPK